MNMNIISKDRSCSWKSFGNPPLLNEEITEESTAEGKKRECCDNRGKIKPDQTKAEEVRKKAMER